MKQKKKKSVIFLIMATFLSIGSGCKCNLANASSREALVPPLRSDEDYMDFDVRAKMLLDGISVEQFNNLVSTDEFWQAKEQFDLRGYLMRFSRFFPERNIEVRFDYADGFETVVFKEEYLLDPDYKSVSIYGINNAYIKNSQLGIRIYGYVDDAQKWSYGRKFYIQKTDLSTKIHIVGENMMVTKAQIELLPKVMTAWLTDPHAKKVVNNLPRGEKATQMNDPFVDEFGSYVDILTK